MEYATIPETSLKVSRVGLGTWAIGGWMWGGTDEDESVRTIHAAVERGINLIDTAPAYGFGRSEGILGRAIGERTASAPRGHGFAGRGVAGCGRVSSARSL